jgi:exonuclease 1
MGIPGLLKAVESITNRVHLREMAGTRLGVDAMCWLHRGLYCCSVELATGVVTNKYIQFFMSMVKLLTDHGIEAVVVFDGRAPPGKESTGEARQVKREHNKALAEEAMLEGDRYRAHQLYQRSVGVSSAMIGELITVLKKAGVEFLVAPYEADSQLAFLNKRGYIDAVITEDSDSLVFGCRKVLFKLEKDGMCNMIHRSDLGSNQGFIFANWTDEQFKLFCCLLGCDYLPKIRNLGPKTAHRMVDRHRSLGRLVDALRDSTFKGITDEWCLMLQKSLLTFRHQWIYDPSTGEQKPLCKLPQYIAQITGDRAMVSRRNKKEGDGVEDNKCMDISFLGEIYSAEVLQKIVHGEVDPYNLQPYIVPRPPVVPEDTVSDASNHSYYNMTSTMANAKRLLPGVTIPSSLKGKFDEVHVILNERHGHGEEIETLQRRKRRLEHSGLLNFDGDDAKLNKSLDSYLPGGVIAGSSVGAIESVLSAKRTMTPLDSMLPMTSSRDEVNPIDLENNENYTSNKSMVDMASKNDLRYDEKREPRSNIIPTASVWAWATR